MSSQMPMMQRRELDCEHFALQSFEESTQKRPLCSRIMKHRICEVMLTIFLVLLSVHAAVHLYRDRFKGGNNNPTLPHLSTRPQVKIVTSSAIEIEWQRDYDGDGPVCGFVVELKPPASTSWRSVGFVPFKDDVNDFEYTIERLDAGTLYEISVIILHCSGREGERGPEISQSTEVIGLSRLSTQPEIKIVTSSTIEIEWERDYDGGGPLCGFVVELKHPASTSWTRVGFVPFKEDVGDFKYTIERLDAGTLYRISVIILHCFGREGERGPEISQSTEDIGLPRLSTQPQVKSVTSSTIEIDWEGANDGDRPVCGFVVELQPPASTSWKSVGFVPFNEDVDEFEYTIDRLDADALYGISIITLYCSGREGERGPEINQSTEDIALPHPSIQPQVKTVTTSTDHEPQTEPPSVSTSTSPPCPAQKWRECPQNPPEDDYPWQLMFFIALFLLLLSIVFTFFFKFSRWCT